MTGSYVNANDHSKPTLNNGSKFKSIVTIIEHLMDQILIVESSHFALT